MNKFLRRITATASTAVLISSLVACSSDDSGTDEDAERGASESTLAELASDEQDAEGAEPAVADGEPPGVLFETEPEFVDVSVPEAVDLNESSEIDGRQVLPPAELDDAVADAADGLTVWLENLNAVEQAGSRPGDIGGPAVQFDVLIHNDSSEPLDLATFIVAAAYGDDEIPAEDVLTEDSRPFSGVVDPGQTLRGVVAFVIPPDERADVIVTVDIEADAQVILFQGEFPQ